MLELTVAQWLNVSLICAAETHHRSTRIMSTSQAALWTYICTKWMAFDSCDASE